MFEIIKDTLLDTLKLLPFLFVAFLIIELIEHKLDSNKIIKKSGKYGPIIGSLLGAFPQCGFSVLATNLYVTRVITLGTLISIYLSTSDEMLPVLLSHNVDIIIILKIIGLKILIGMISGFIIDLILRKKVVKTNYEICDEEHCNCKNGIIKSSLIHTLKTGLFLIFITFILNIIFEFFGETFISKLFLKNSIFAPFISSLVGLIPNCGSSLLITELYLNGAINFSSLLSGLLTGSGVAILVLFKSNKDKKDNLKILLLIYFIGVISGIITILLNKLL